MKKLLKLIPIIWMHIVTLDIYCMIWGSIKKQKNVMKKQLKLVLRV